MHSIQRTSVVTFRLGRPVRQGLTAEFRFSTSGICGGRSVTGTGYSPSNSVFSFQYNSNIAPLSSSFTSRPLSEGEAGEAWVISIIFMKSGSDVEESAVNFVVVCKGVGVFRALLC